MTRIPVWSDRSARRIAQSVRFTENADQSLLTPGREGNPFGTTHIRLWNKTGSLLEPGQAVALGEPIEPASNVVMFRDVVGVETKLPDATYKDFGRLALITAPIDTDTFGQGQVAGAALTQVNVTHGWHQWADLEPSQYRLQSHPAGTVRIIAREPGTGVKWAYVLLNNPGPAIWGAKSTGTITAGGTGPANIYDDSSTQQEPITVTLPWLHSGDDISTDKELAITWRGGAWVVLLAECE